MPDISEGSIEAKVRRYISGQWVEGWASSAEFCPTTTAISFAESAPVSQCTPKPCPKVKLLEVAEKGGWPADDVIKALKALGG